MPKKIDKRHKNPGRTPLKTGDKRIKLPLWGKEKHVVQIKETFQPLIDDFSEGLDKKESNGKVDRKR